MARPGRAISNSSANHKNWGGGQDLSKSVLKGRHCIVGTLPERLADGRHLPDHEAGQAEEQLPHPPGQGEGEGNAGFDAEGASHQDVASLLDTEGAWDCEGACPDRLPQAFEEQGRPDINGVAEEVKG